MSITPDTKDWTWVLLRPCPECGFDARSVAREDVAALIRDNADAWRQVFDQRADVARRPDPRTWSPLEYGCHVRDVFQLYDYRLRLMLESDDPHYPNWDQDATAVESGYSTQDPAKVIVELRSAAEALAGAFAGVSGDQWQRTGNRSDGATFTVESFARYLLHDVVHHLHDVDKTL